MNQLEGINISCLRLSRWTKEICQLFLKMFFEVLNFRGLMYGTLTLFLDQSWYFIPTGVPQLAACMVKVQNLFHNPSSLSFHLRAWSSGTHAHT